MEELICREGTVHSVIFQNAENGYTVLRLLTEEGEVVTVVGCIPCVAPGEHLTVTGTWEVHPQHGEQLKAQELERTLPEEEEDIFAYLSSGICRGVGPATARRIVDRFGVETLEDGLITRDFVDNFIQRIDVTPLDDGHIKLDIQLLTDKVIHREFEKIKGRTGQTSKKMIQSYEQGMSNE